MDSPKLHICFVSKILPLTKIADVYQQGLWPITDRLSKMGHKISIISHKTAFEQSEFKRGNTNVYLISNKEEFSSIQDFSKLAEIKIKDIHSNHPIDHIHSLDTPLKNFKKIWGKQKPSLSYGVQSTRVEDFFRSLVL